MKQPGEGQRHYSVMPEPKDTCDGEKWAEMAIDDLRAFIKGRGFNRGIASSLCRSADIPEVEAKARVRLTVCHE
jgi:hypothetical protein